MSVKSALSIKFTYLVSYLLTYVYFFLFFLMGQFI